MANTTVISSLTQKEIANLDKVPLFRSVTWATATTEPVIPAVGTGIKWALQEIEYQALGPCTLLLQEGGTTFYTISVPAGAAPVALGSADDMRIWWPAAAANTAFNVACSGAVGLQIRVKYRLSYPATT